MLKLTDNANLTVASESARARERANVINKATRFVITSPLKNGGDSRHWRAFLRHEPYHPTKTMGL